MRHRFLNDFIPDLFCMFPILTTVHFYRVFTWPIINSPTTPSAIRIC